MSPASRARYADHERALRLFLRGMLGFAPRVRCAPGAVSRAFVQEDCLFFPEHQFAASPGQAALGYFAAAAHLVAHLRHGAPRAPRGGLKPIQWVLISLLEDARVEARLLAECPGLRALWDPFHRAEPTELATFPALCARMTRVLFDARYHDPLPLLAKLRAGFWGTRGDTPDPALCRQLGSLLGNDIGQLRLPFNAKEYRAEPAYRDDHRLQWEEETPADAPALHEEVCVAGSAPARARNAFDARGSRTPPQAAGSPSELVRTSAAAATADLETRTRGYPEWDYRIGLSRPAFSTVREVRSHAPAPRSEPSAPPALPVTLRRRLERAARTLHVRSARRRTRFACGGELDLGAAICARIEVLARGVADDRVYLRSTGREARLALLLLLDLSASTASRVPGSSATLIDLARDASWALGSLLARSATPFAVHGFASNGRDEVNYEIVKDFHETWGAHSWHRLRALEPDLSTRMGAALRHAGAQLASTSAQRRLILLLTDGEPSDVDAPDPNYLLLDARHAVQELRRQRTTTFGVSLDRAGGAYSQTVFGRGRYVVLNRLEQLSATLPRLFMLLAR
jgi:nitric oxide reductase NorD protein